MSAAWYRYVNGRLIAMRANRYSWFVHWRDLADYFLPRRYRWVVNPNQFDRGQSINQRIIDSSGVIFARNLAAGMMSGKTNPSRPWFKLMVGRIDSSQTNPISLWLSECERLMRLVFQESNFYSSVATYYFDLVIFGTANMILYEDYENVIKCYNPAMGEYYVELDQNFRPTILYREFTMTIGALVQEFGLENCSSGTQAIYNRTDGSGLSTEIIVAHAIEPNTDGRSFGIPARFPFRECFWEYGGSNSPQNASNQEKFLRTRGYYSQPFATCRWDVTSNDPYGRSPGMDALGDQKQLQQETKRKSQAIDKMVNPPMVADVQMKNQPASLLPGGMTYLAGYAQTGKGFSSVYDTKFPVGEMTEDLREVRERMKKIFFNDLFQPLSQYETRSNITAVEIDQRKAESLIMLGPVFTRTDVEALAIFVERTWDVMNRAGIIPPPPQEVAGAGMTVKFVSMLQSAMDASQANAIERVLGLAGNLAGIDPAVMDKINVDYTIDRYSHLLDNDPRMMRSDDQVAAIRENRQKQAQAAQVAETASAGADAAKNLASADLSSNNALTALLGAPSAGAV